MKRLLALLLVLMLSVSFSAVAEDVDVKALDNDALSMLYSKVQAEALDRGVLQILPAGVYTGNGDLPKGLYVCKARKSGSVWLYRGFEGYIAEDRSYISAWFLDEGEQFTLRLTGDVCYDVWMDAAILSFTPAE